MRKMLRMIAAQKVVDQLVPTEVVLDEALACAAKLISASIEARIEARLPIHCGQQAIKRMSSVVKLIARARDELIEVHSELVETKILVGLGPVSYGGLGGCPVPSGEGDQPPVSLAG